MDYRLKTREIPPVAFLVGVLFVSRSNNSLRQSVVEGPFATKIDPVLEFSVVLAASLAARFLAGKEQSAAIAYAGLVLSLWQRCSLLMHQPGAEKTIFGGVSSVRSIDIVFISVVQLSGIMLGHELLHQQRNSRFWSCLVLFPGGYASYCWEHVFHHRYAGTELDPASTVRGTSIYKFLQTNYPTHLRSAFRHCPATLACTSAAFVLGASLFAITFSAKTALLFVVVTLVHWFLVDVGTYTSHYGVVGLPRRGRADEVNLAWDARMWPIVAPFFYGIEKHVDHHRHPTWSVDKLDFRGRLRYPVTLEIVVLVAFFPKIWFLMTNPILDRIQDRTAGSMSQNPHEHRAECNITERRDKKIVRSNCLNNAPKVDMTRCQKGHDLKSSDNKIVTTVLKCFTAAPLLATLALSLLLISIFPLCVSGGEHVEDVSECKALSSDLVCDSRGVARIHFDHNGNFGMASTEARRFAERNEPFVCRKCLPRDSLLWWKDDANLANAAGNEIIRVRSLKRAAIGEPSYFQRIGETKHSHLNISLRDFLVEYSDASSNYHLYAAQIDIAKTLPQLSTHLPLLPTEFLEAIGPPVSKLATTVYMGAGAPETQLHYDSFENLVCIVAGGYKLFELYDPITSSALLYFNQKEYGNVSPVPPDEDEKRENYPMAKYALSSKVRLEPGDCLYLPIYWFHGVRSSKDRTISINWWRRPKGKKKDTIGKLMCGHTHRKSSANCA